MIGLAELFANRRSPICKLPTHPVIATTCLDANRPSSLPLHRFTWLPLGYSSRRRPPIRLSTSSVSTAFIFLISGLPLKNRSAIPLTPIGGVSSSNRLTVGRVLAEFSLHRSFHHRARKYLATNGKDISLPLESIVQFESCEFVISQSEEIK